MFESCFTRDLDEKKRENWIGREFFSKTFLVGLKISGASTGPPPYIQIYIKKENTYLFVIGTQRERNEFVSPWDFLLSIFFSSVFVRPMLRVSHSSVFFLSLSLSLQHFYLYYIPFCQGGMGGFVGWPTYTLPASAHIAFLYFFFTCTVRRNRPVDQLEWIASALSEEITIVPISPILLKERRKKKKKKRAALKKKKRAEREQKEIGRKQNKRVWVYNLPPCWVC